MHQRGKTELAQKIAFDVEGAGLRHRQRRHVHHVRERVVVVFLERGQRQERGAILGDQAREPVDDLPRRRRIGLLSRLGGVPERLCGLYRGVVHAPGGGDARLLGGSLLDDDPSHGDVADAARAQAIGQRGGRRPFAEHGDEAADLLAGHAAREGDLLDVAFAEVAREPGEQRGAARQPVAVDDDLVADEPDHDGRSGVQTGGGGAGQRVDAAFDERVRRRVELDSAQCRRESPDQLFALLLIHDYRLRP